MSAHTPGPWAAYRVRSGLQVENRGLLTHIADVRGDRDDGDARLHALSATEDDANARLIAAAPDLLEAAKLGLGYIVSDYENSRGSFGAASVDAGRIQAAIAKAEGR